MKVKQNEHSVHWLVAGFLSDLTAVCYDHYSKFKHDALYKFYFFYFLGPEVDTVYSAPLIEAVCYFHNFYSTVMHLLLP